VVLELAAPCRTSLHSSPRAPAYTSRFTMTPARWSSHCSPELVCQSATPSVLLGHLRGEHTVPLRLVQLHLRPSHVELVAIGPPQLLQGRASCPPLPSRRSPPLPPQHRNTTGSYSVVAVARDKKQLVMALRGEEKGKERDGMKMKRSTGCYALPRNRAIHRSLTLAQSITSAAC
jgi:hypothetical protein